MANVAFIGLGVMGYPMAGHLKKRGGHEVTVYNRTAAKADKWVSAFGGTSAATPRQAASGADFVFSCVGADNDLREITIGAEGAFHGMKRGATFIDHTTASADVARELHAAAKDRGLSFIDAPVSGGQAGAENGVLTVMCGGDTPAYKSAEPLIECYSRMRRLLGPSGSGQLAKMVNQIAIAESHADVGRPRECVERAGRVARGNALPCGSAEEPSLLDAWLIDFVDQALRPGEPAGRLRLLARTLERDEGEPERAAGGTNRLAAFEIAGMCPRPCLHARVIVAGQEKGGGKRIEIGRIER